MTSPGDSGKPDRAARRRLQRLTSSPEFGRPYAALTRADRRLVDGLVSTGRGADARAIIRERGTARLDNRRAIQRAQRAVNKDEINARRRAYRNADSYSTLSPEDRTDSRDDQFVTGKYGDDGEPLKRSNAEVAMFWTRYKENMGYV